MNGPLGSVSTFLFSNKTKRPKKNQIFKNVETNEATFKMSKLLRLALFGTETSKCTA